MSLYAERVPGPHWAAGTWRTTMKKSTKKTGTKKSAKVTAKTKAPKAAAQKAQRKPAADATPKRLSALDAAAEVLKTDGQPMRCKELIAAMAERGLWTSPGGKTPEATLYAAMLREINTKGHDARFRKVERGQFAFADGR
jgi:hypothetical protein